MRGPRAQKGCRQIDPCRLRATARLPGTPGAARQRRASYTGERLPYAVAPAPSPPYHHSCPAHWLSQRWLRPCLYSQVCGAQLRRPAGASCSAAGLPAMKLISMSTHPAIHAGGGTSSEGPTGACARRRRAARLSRRPPRLAHRPASRSRFTSATPRRQLRGSAREGEGVHKQNFAMAVPLHHRASRSHGGCSLPSVHRFQSLAPKTQELALFTPLRPRPPHPRASLGTCGAAHTCCRWQHSGVEATGGLQEAWVRGTLVGGLGGQVRPPCSRTVAHATQSVWWRAGGMLGASATVTFLPQQSRRLPVSPPQQVR